MRRELQMKAFRPTLLAAVMTALMAGVPALADTADKLDRVKVDLIAPPMVHAHEQKATSGPKVVEFRMSIEEKKIVIDDRSEEHTSELQSLMRISYAVFCLKKKKTPIIYSRYVTRHTHK